MSTLPNRETEAIEAFYKDMQKELLANMHKGGWSNDPPHLLLARIYEEVAELTEALKPEKKAHESFAIAAHHLRCASMVLRVWGPGLSFHNRREEVISEAADIANMAMMIADNRRRSAQ